MKTTIHIFFFVVVIFSVSCKNDKTSTTRIADVTRDTDTVASWVGDYEGVLPCEDCRGRKINIRLTADSSFVKKTIYMGRSDEAVIERGAIQWSDDGKMVQFQESTQNTIYRKDDIDLLLIYENGQVITNVPADDYRLSRMK